VIDLHCHLLPGIDDGPRDMETAIELARAAAVDGVETAAATPHVRPDYPRVVPSELAERCGELGERLFAEGVELELVPGGEVDLLWALEASDDDLRLCSYGQLGTDLLVETPYDPLLPTFEDMLFRLTLKGHRILLAHPERNPTFQGDPNRLAALVQQGVLLQVTADSLVRAPRQSRSAELARRLVLDGLTHALASDAHGATTVERASLGESADRASDLVGAQRARWLVEDAPAAIAAGRPLPPMPAAEPRRRGLVSRLLRG
jgi:protein-tyrosine phosphatase